MTERHDHLRIRIPDKGELTLSMPEGVLRALRDQRLPSSAEVWDGDREEWVSLAGHPGILGLLQSISAHTTKVQERAVPARRVAQPTFAGAIETRKAAPLPQHRPGEGDDPGAIELIDLELPSTAELLGEAPDFPAIPPEASGGDLGDSALSLMDIAAGAGSDEPATAPGIPPAKADRPARTSKQTAVVTESPVAAAPEKVEPAYPLQVTRRRKKGPEPPVVSVRRKRIPAAAVVGALLLIVLGGAGFAWYRGRAASHGDSASRTGVLAGAVKVVGSAAAQAPVNPPVGDSLEGGAIQRGDSAAVPDLPLQGVSGAEPEPDLETSIRLADAVAWVPAQDFGSAQGLLLARRKLEAVRNSIGAYRVDMNRLSDSAKTTADYRRRVEPFAEARRVDEVIDVLQSAVQRLDSLSGRFHVAGGSVAFDRPADAGQWVALLHQADSLLAAPVELDSYPAFRRAPRRIVTRLVETLPQTR